MKMRTFLKARTGDWGAVRCEDLLAGPASRWPGKLRVRNKHTGAVETVRSVMGTTVYFEENGYPWSTRSVRIHWEPANNH